MLVVEFHAVKLAITKVICAHTCVDELWYLIISIAITLLINHFLNFCLCVFVQVSATDPDCGVNAIVNYTMGDGFNKYREFEVNPSSGEICISSPLDHEKRSIYEFPILATDRGKTGVSLFTQHMPKSKYMLI